LTGHGKKRPAEFADRQRQAAEFAVPEEIFAELYPANNSTLPKTSRAFAGKFCVKGFG